MKRTVAERGRMGGTATAARHGNTHMGDIGRAAFWATALRHYGGDPHRSMEALRRRQSSSEPDARLGCQVVRTTH